MMLILTHYYDILKLGVLISGQSGKYIKSERINWCYNKNIKNMGQ